MKEIIILFSGINVIVVFRFFSSSLVSFKMFHHILTWFLGLFSLILIGGP